MTNPIAGPVSHPVERFPPGKILVPVDFSRFSEAAAQAAVGLGRRWKARLEFVHISEAAPAELTEGAGAPPERRRLGEYFARLEDRIRDMAGGYPEVGVRVEEGYPKAALAELASPEFADWAVMGTRGRTGLARLALGSVAESLVRVSRIPILTVHAGLAPDWPRRILVPMTVAPYADEALKRALALAGNLGARLSLLHVSPDVAGQRKSLQALEERLAALPGKARLELPRPIAAVGHPAETILRIIRAEGFDLVVLAAHRKPFWEALVLGTTAERVLRYAPVPVLSIPSVEARKTAARRPSLFEKAEEAAAFESPGL